MASSAATPYGTGYFGAGAGSDNNGSVSSEAPGLAPPAHVPPPRRRAGTGGDALQSTARGAVWQGQQPSAPGSNWTGYAPVPHPPSFGPAVTSSDPPACGGGGGGGGGAPGAYSTAGEVAAPRLLQQQAGAAATATTSALGSSAAPEEEEGEDEDEATRELRIALEEEIQFYGTKGASNPTAAHTSNSNGSMAAAAAARNAEDIGQQQQDELAWVLEQSRLEAELQQSRQAVADEGEEEMLARVLEESRREQEKRNAEQLELQRVSTARGNRVFLFSLLENVFTNRCRESQRGRSAPFEHLTHRALSKT